LPAKKASKAAAGRFKVGDHVTWNSEAGRVSGVIIKVHVRDFDYKGHTHHASADYPSLDFFITSCFKSIKLSRNFSN